MALEQMSPSLSISQESRAFLNRLKYKIPQIVLHWPLYFVTELHPINVVVYNDPEKSNLVAGFVLRCFQLYKKESDPDSKIRAEIPRNPDIKKGYYLSGGRQSIIGKPEV